MDDIEKLLKFNADDLFPSLLTDAQKEQIHRARKKKAEIKKRKTGVKVKSYELDVKTDEYVLKGGGYDDFGQPIDDFNISQYMADMEDSETGTLHDLKIDTRDLPLAKNFYDYCFTLTGKKVHKPWSRQLWIGAMLNAEICPCCSKKEWLDVNNVPKDFASKDLPEYLCFLENGKCPKCKRTKWELIQNHGLNNYIQLVNVLGQRSGKSSSAAMYASYHLHRMLKFPVYATLTNSMQSSTELTGTMVSLSFAKAIGVMWTPFRKLVTEESEWYAEYFRKMDYYKNLYGKELYRTSTLYMTFGLKNLKMYPSGPKASTLRGDTRWLAMLDELGLFKLPSGNEEEDENSEIANADEAHKSLYNSLTTVNMAYNELLAKGYNTAPPALLMSVSSPMSIRDKVMRLYRESKTEEGSKYILGVNLPTWEVNPNMTRQTPVIAAAYASNPEKAERDFGANPPIVHSRFLSVNSVNDKVFSGKPNSHSLTYQFDQPEMIYGRLDKVRPLPYIPGVVALDAGSTNNSFSIAAGHYDFESGKTVVTTLLECMPQQGRRIDFNLLYAHVILPLCKATNAVWIAADQWQSIDLLHRTKADMGNNPIQKPRTLATQYSPKRKDFENFRGMLESGSIILPSRDPKEIDRILNGDIANYKTEMIGKPVEHLMLQMLTVRDVGPARCPEKGEGYTDDLFRATVLLVNAIHKPKCMERLVEAKDFNYLGERQGMPKPVFVSRGSPIHTQLARQMRR
jgi:hypothetical protein